MTKEELLAIEMREDRRLVELGLDPHASAPALWEKLDKMVEEIKQRERNEDKVTRPPADAPIRLNKQARPLTRQPQPILTANEYGALHFPRRHYNAAHAPAPSPFQSYPDRY